MQALGLIYCFHVLYSLIIVSSLGISEPGRIQFKTLALSLLLCQPSGVFLQSSRNDPPDAYSTALGQISSIQDLTLLMSPSARRQPVKVLEVETSCQLIYHFLLKVRNAETTWKVREYSEDDMYCFLQGQICQALIKEQERIKGNCNRRLRSQKPANSGTCNDTHDKHQTSEVPSSACAEASDTTVNLHFELCNSK